MVDHHEKLPFGIMFLELVPSIEQANPSGASLFWMEDVCGENLGIFVVQPCLEDHPS